MKNVSKHRSPLLIMALGFAILLGIVFAVLVGYRLVSGQSLGLRSLVRDQVYLATSYIKANTSSAQVKSYSKGEFTNILFLHHSVGLGLIEAGGLREDLSQRGYNLWDQGYNWEGLRGPDGSSLGYTYNIPADNTDPDGLADLFAQQVHDQPLNAFSGLMQHEVILFKSCFPTSSIQNEAQLEEYKSYYLGMRAVMDQHPDKLFVVLTPPPLIPYETDQVTAKRAKEWASWLASDEFLAGHDNVRTFDLFSALAEPDQTRADANMLRDVYRTADSHPNEAGSAAAAQMLADFVDQSIQTYRGMYASQD